MLEPEECRRWRQLSTLRTRRSGECTLFVKTRGVKEMEAVINIKNQEIR